MSESTATAGEPLIETHALTKRFGDEYAVRELDLLIRPGIIYGFIGPSGSGKTTTVRLLAGIQRPTSGSARVLGVEPWRFSALQRRQIGYMPQLSVLYPQLSIQENLNFVASIYGLPLRRARRLRDALEFVELHEHRRKKLRSASGGMQRRLALAAALLHEPELVFLDEPTAGIDPVLRRKLWDRFEELRSRGRTLFVTTQYVGEAAYCDLIGVLAEGRLLMVDTPEGLRRTALGGDLIEIEAEQRLDDADVDDARRLPYVRDAVRRGHDGQFIEALVDEADSALPQLQAWCQSRGLKTVSIQQYEPPFDDVFVKLVEKSGAS